MPDQPHPAVETGGADARLEVGDIVVAPLRIACQDAGPPVLALQGQARESLDKHPLPLPRGEPGDVEDHRFALLKTPVPCKGPRALPRDGTRCQCLKVGPPVDDGDA